MTAPTFPKRVNSRRLRRLQPDFGADAPAQEPQAPRAGVDGRGELPKIPIIVRAKDFTDGAERTMLHRRGM
jgi:hypothetical protein